MASCWLLFIIIFAATLSVWWTEPFYPGNMENSELSSRYSLRVKLKSTEKKEIPHIPKKSAKDYYHQYRAKLKQDPIRYEEFKNYDSLKKKQYRKSLTESERQRYNEKAKMRMRAYRQRQKEKETKEKPTTRHKIAKMREYWREMKRKQRAKLSEEQKQSANEKRRALYKVKAKKKLFNDLEKQTPKASQSCYIPKSTDKFVETISKALSNATPRKINALSTKGIITSKKEVMKNETNSKIVARVKCAINNLKRQQSKEGRQRYRLLTSTLVGKYAVEHKLREALGLKWDYWLRMSALETCEPVKRIDAFSEKTVKNIETFYEYESVTLPSKKTVSGKTLKQKRVLTDTIQQVHKRFLRDNPELKVSLSHFRKLRPKEVLTVTQQKFALCLCEYCLNVQFKIDSINQAFKRYKVDRAIESKYHVVDLTLCDKNSRKYHARKCVQRKCEDCGTKKLETFLGPLVDLKTGTIFTWKRWELGTVGTCGVEKVRRQVLVEHSGDFESLMSEFLKEVDFLASHLFVASWQYNQFNELSKSVPEGSLVTVADFSENYRCVQQDEIQSAYYNYSQLSLFPMIAYYNCPDCNKSVVQESAVFITPDLTHDSYAVDQFSKEMVDHIKTHANITDEIQFSDGCASQFKSKYTFFNVSKTKTHRFERAYFGSRHGKSPCDALGGLVKKAAELHVKSRKGLIQNAKAFFEFCKENLAIHSDGRCEHKRRVFFYHETIKREKPTFQIQTLKGTRQLHSIAQVKPGVVKYRHLSCFCHQCLTGDDNCLNEEHVGKWNTHSLIRDTVKGEQMKKKTKGVEKTQSKTISTAQKEKQKGKKTEIRDCSSIVQLKKIIHEKNFEKLPQQTHMTFCSTEKTIDKNSVELVPDDIPLQKEQLHPAVIYGDGNCLSRCASVLAYGDEERHIEMRERIVCELVIRQKYYLDNEYLRKGMNPQGHSDVAKTFASYSDFYYGAPLNEQNINKIFEQEILHVCKPGKYMGLWQLACLSNILLCPVVSVCPKYGCCTVRSDMHRIFYPLEDVHRDKEPVFIMWTNINGKLIREKDFAVNHFDVLMPIANTTDIDLEMQDFDKSSIDSPYESDDFDESIWAVLNDVDMEFEFTNDFDQCSSQIPNTINVTNPTDVAPSCNLNVEASKSTVRNSTETKVPEQLTTLKSSPSTSSHNADPVIDQEKEVGTISEVAEQTSLNTMSTRYPIGTNVSVRHGSEMLYAVVVPNPDEEQNDHGQWIKFYKRAKPRLWVLEEKPFFVCWEDICEKIEEPSLSASGSRLYYKF